MGRLQRKKNQQAKNKNRKSTGRNLSQHHDLSKIQPSNKNSNVVREHKTGATTGVNNFLAFFRESKLELKKVVWPTKKQTLGSTLVVIVIVSLAALFLGIVDMGLSGVVRALLG